VVSHTKYLFGNHTLLQNGRCQDKVVVQTAVLLTKRFRRLTWCHFNNFAVCFIWCCQYSFPDTHKRHFKTFLSHSGFSAYTAM